MFHRQKLVTDFPEPIEIFKTSIRKRKRKFTMEDGMFECQVCHKKVMNISKHMRSHEQFLYACGFCGAELTRKDNLKRHIKIQHSAMMSTEAMNLWNMSI